MISVGSEINCFDLNLKEELIAIGGEFDHVNIQSMNKFSDQNSKLRSKKKFSQIKAYQDVKFSKIKENELVSAPS